MWITISSFVISVISLIVTILSFILAGNKENEKLRYGLGGFFLIFTFLFCSIGLFSFVQGIRSESTPTPSIISTFPAQTSTPTQVQHPPQPDTPTPILPKPTVELHSQEPIQKISEQFFTFALIGCTQSGGTVACDLIITNNGEDRVIRIYGSADDSEMYDDLGNFYDAPKVEFANKKSSYEVKLLLVSNVPTPAKIIFEEVATQANRIALFRLDGRAEDSFLIEFRDIPLIKQ